MAAAMVIWLKRHKGALTFALSLLMITLGLANAWKHQLISTDWLNTHKDALSALNSIVALLILIAGSLFSYYRFFRGRTLSLRAELSIDVSVHNTPEQFLLHAVTLTAKNVGSSTIWNPTPHISVRVHGPPGLAEGREITDWWNEDRSEDTGATAPVIEAGETVSFFTHQEIASKAWAVTYFASLRADTGDAWFVSKTVTNGSAA